MLSDFWWLPPEERTKFSYVDVYCQSPYSDQLNTNITPTSCGLRNYGRHSYASLESWKTSHKNTNIFRSLKVFSINNDDAESRTGPLILDIDRIDETSQGYIPNIEQALKDVRLLVSKCLSTLRAEDYRVIFSGHKGFHVEINPNSLNIPQNEKTLNNFRQVRKNVNNMLGYSFVDQIHEHLRFHDSVNSWIDNVGHNTRCMVFEITSELSEVSATYLYKKGLELVSDI